MSRRIQYGQLRYDRNGYAVPPNDVVLVTRSKGQTLDVGARLGPELVRDSLKLNVSLQGHASRIGQRANAKDEMVFSPEPPVSRPRKGGGVAEAEVSAQIKGSGIRLTREGTGWL
jgi:hypothetical protein